MWWPTQRKDGTFVARPCIFTLANGKLIRASRNNYISQDGNMGLACPDRLPNDLFGVGLIEKMHPNIHGANSVLDMILTNLELTVDKQKVVSKDQVRNPTAAQRNYAGNTIFVNGDARTAVSWVDGGNISADAFAALGLFRGDSAAASGVKPIKTGSLQAGVTATSDMIAQQEGSTRFSLSLLMLENTFVKQTARRMHKINQQFLDVPMLVPIVEGDAEDWPAVDAQTIAIDPDFVPEGSRREINKQMEVAQIENFLSIISSVPALYPVVPMIIGKLARQFRWDEAKEIEQLATMAIQNFMIMSQMTAASAGGGQGGSPSSGGGRLSQTSSHGNMAGIESTNQQDLNQSLLGGAGVSAFS
jgi:hypothetical protein